MTAGRPTKFTEQRKKIILEAIEGGAFHVVAAQASGISEETFTGWKKIARKDIAEDRDTEHARFYESVKTAEAQYVNRCAKRIDEAGGENWQALAWLMERMYPHIYGRKWRNTTEKLKIEGDKHPEKIRSLMFNIEKGTLTVDEAAKLAKIFQEEEKISEFEQLHAELESLKKTIESKITKSNTEVTNGDELQHGLPDE